MRFSQNYDFTGTVDDVFRARCDQGVREQACKSSGALSWNVQIESSGGTTRVEVTRVLAPDLPPMYKSFVGDTVTVTQRESWTGAPDSSRRAEVHVAISGQPATMIGTSVLTAVKAGGCTELTEGEVKVAIPLFGSKVEPEIAKVVGTALRHEQQAAQEWLARSARS